MSDVFRSPEDYELYIYTLPDKFPSIKKSNLTFVRRGSALARVAGELQFDHGYRLVVLERLRYDRKPMLIDGYGFMRFGNTRRSATGTILRRIPMSRG